MTDTPCVLLGHAPARSGGAPWAPDADATIRLARLVQCEPEALGRYFALANLVDRFTGDQASREDFAAGAERWSFRPGFRYILAGEAVLRALGKRRAYPRRGSGVIGGGVRTCWWYETREGVTCAVINHPSGANKNLNDREEREATRRFLREARWMCSGRADDMWRAARGSVEG